MVRTFTALGVIALAAALPTASWQQPDHVEVLFLDVGQAEAIVIRSPEGQAIWQQKDHTVRMDEVRAELRRLTGE